MQLARVCGQVISTKKAEKLMGFKILVCQPIDMVTFEEKGAPFVSIDSVGAGEGELVMCVSGSSSRQTMLTDAKPVDNAIVAIIDSVDILGERCFDKADPEIKPAAAKKAEQPAAKKASPAKPKTDDKQTKASGTTKEVKQASEKQELKMTDTKPKKTTKKKAEPKAKTDAEVKPKAAAKPADKDKKSEDETAKKIIEDIMKKLDEQEENAKQANSTKKAENEPKNK